MEYKVGKDVFYKCRKCHEADPILRNYQECKVYSRVCGYIQATDKWNPGKQEEFKDRVTFNNK